MDDMKNQESFRIISYLVLELKKIMEAIKNFQLFRIFLAWFRR